MNQPDSQSSRTQHLLPNPAQDQELGQKYTNELKINELDSQLANCRMQAYYFWIIIYCILTVSSARWSFDIFNEVQADKVNIVMCSVYLKAFIDGLTVCGCLLIFVGISRKFLGIIEKVILIFKVNLGSTIAFYLLVAILCDRNYTVFGMLSGGVAFLNILPVRKIQDILAKRQALDQYSSDLIGSLN